MTDKNILEVKEPAGIYIPQTEAERELRKMSWVYEVVIQARDKIAGGRPKDENLMRTFLKTKGLAEEEIDQVVEEDLNIMKEEDKVGEDGEEKEKTLEEEMLRQTTGFKCIDDHLIVEGRMLKACFREAAAIFQIPTKLKGFKHWMQVGLSMKPEILCMYDMDGKLIDEADFNFNMLNGNVITKDHELLAEEHPVVVYQPTLRIKQSCIKRLELVHRPIIKFEVWCRENGMISNELLRHLLVAMQDIGIGAARPLGYGQFNILRMDLVNVPEVFVMDEVESIQGQRKSQAKKHQDAVRKQKADEVKKKKAEEKKQAVADKSTT